MIYINNKQVGLSANEVNNLITKLIENKQDKKIVFEGQEMLLTTALQRVNNSAVGKANITVAQRLPDTLIPNTQYWVDEYNGQTLANGCYIIMVDNLGVPHPVGQSPNKPTLQDVQINGKSIIDGATQIVNIQPKAVINDTATDDDIPSAKGVWNLVNAGGGGSGGLSVEDVSDKITLQTNGTIQNLKALKIGNSLLFLIFQVQLEGAYATPSVSIGNLQGLENIGVNISYDIAGCSQSNGAICNTYIKSINKSVYIKFASSVNGATVRFSYLIPINI